MTSKYYCPICGKDLHMTNDVFSICTNESCKIYTLPIPNTVSDYLEQIAQALIQSQKDLGIARKALKETQHWLGVVRCSAVSHLNNQNNTLLEHYETDPTVQNIDKAKSILKQYLEQIEHKEQI